MEEYITSASLVSMDIRLVFARNLRMLRSAKGLSQEALAHEAGIDRTYISALERSVYGATIDMVDDLARALGVEAAELLRRSPHPAGDEAVDQDNKRK